MSDFSASVVDLLTYIEEVEKLKRKPAYVVPSDYFVGHLADMKGSPELQSNLTTADGEVWLRIPRLQEQTAPLLPDELALWTVLSKSVDKQPTLKEEIPVFLEDVRRLKKKVEDGAIIPSVIEEFVRPGGDEIRVQEEVAFRGLSTSSSGQGVKELFFPMPYNEEQVSIVRKLEANNGVVVQGPPGTGKTHTIANVICHYLAQGKRVLVTSKGETALSVLQEKFIKPAATPSLPASAKKVTASAASTSEQSQKLPHIDMDLLTACRTLNVKAEANWSLIDAARSQLVNLSNPVTLKALDSLEKEKRVENAKQANVAFAALLKNRLF